MRRYFFNTTVIYLIAHVSFSQCGRTVFFKVATLKLGRVDVGNEAIFVTCLVGLSLIVSGVILLVWEK